MKSLPVYLPENAIAALTEIGGFIAETSGSVEAAMAFVDRIERRCHRIGDVPRGGIARPGVIEHLAVQVALAHFPDIGLRLRSVAGAVEGK